MASDKSLVVYTYGGGRLGNQFIRFAHWIAWVLAHPDEVAVINLAFWQYAEFFSMWSKGPACAFPQSSVVGNACAGTWALLPPLVRSRISGSTRRFIHNCGRMWPGCNVVTLNDNSGATIDLGGREFVQRVIRYKVTMCSGWRIASWSLFAEHQAEVRLLFQPTPKYTSIAVEFVGALRRRYDVVVGLLIRQTDYLYWNEGRFRFSGNDYVNWIKQLLDLHSGKRVAIVIASDEWQDPNAFAGLHCYFATGSVNAGGHWFESFVELSMCDFVVSPPSTFSACAAYLGAVSLWPLLERKQILSFDQLLHDALVDAALHPVFSLSVK